MLQFIYGDEFARSYRRDWMVAVERQERIDAATGASRRRGGGSLIRGVHWLWSRSRKWIGQGIGNEPIDTEVPEQLVPEHVIDVLGARREGSVLASTTLAGRETGLAFGTDDNRASLP